MKPSIRRLLGYHIPPRAAAPDGCTACGGARLRWGWPEPSLGPHAPECPLLSSGCGGDLKAVRADGNQFRAGPLSGGLKILCVPELSRPYMMDLGEGPFIVTPSMDVLRDALALYEQRHGRPLSCIVLADQPSIAAASATDGIEG